MGVADHLAAELDPAAVGQLDLLDPAADPVARLEHGDRGAAGLEVARGAEPGEPGADDDDVRVVGHRSTTACSGSQPICTRSPAFQRSSARIRGQVLLEHGEGDAGGDVDEVLRRGAVVARRDDRAGHLHHRRGEVAEPDLLRAGWRR